MATINLSDSITTAETVTVFEPTKTINVFDSISVKDYGTSVDFNQATSNITFVVPTSFDPANLTSFTYAVWLYPRTIDNTARRIFDSGAATNTGQGFTIYVRNITDGLTLKLSGNGSSEYTSIYPYTALTLNAWNRLVATYNGSVWNLYINGVQITATSSVSPNGSRTNWSGTTAFIGNTPATNRTYDGLMDEVCLYNKVLSASEITSDSNGTILTDSSLLLRYKFEEGSGTTATDSSNSALTGTIGQSAFSTNTPYNPVQTPAFVSEGNLISEVDNVTVAENTQIIYSVLDVSVSDNVTATESITPLEKNLVANVFDGIGVQGSVSNFSSQQISFGENATVSENVTVLQKNLVSSVFDSVTAAETVTTFQQLYGQISISDNISASESFTVRANPPPLSLSVFDTATAAEGPSNDFLLNEDGTYVLLEDGSKIILGTGYPKGYVANNVRVFDPISVREGKTALIPNSIKGLAAFTTFDVNGVPTRNLIKMDNFGNLKKMNLTTKTWIPITGFTYHAGAPVEMVMGLTTLGKLYVVDGHSPLTYTDGNTITTFAFITDPTAGLALSTAGTAGNTKYSYAYTLVGKAGESKPCATVDITTGNSKLDATNYNIITITRSTDSNVMGYNVYGKTSTSSLYFIGNVQQSYSGNLVFNDIGVVPNTQFALPTYNTTSGPVFSMLKVYQNTLLGAGDPQNPSRLYYTAGLDKFDSFELIDGAGFQNFNLEDGDVITGMEIFKDRLMVFKNRSQYLFAFGTPVNGISVTTVQVINPALGAASNRSIKATINDVYYLSPVGQVYQAGYQQGYYGTNTAELVRNQELSVKIHPTIATINPNRLANAAAIYSVPNYKYILAYADGNSSINNKLAVFDTRYNAWAIWDNMSPNIFVNYVDPNNNELVVYGDEQVDRVVEMFTGLSDRGGAFTFRMRTKEFNADAFHLVKTWIWPTYHFRNILGKITTTIITDGASNQSTTQIGSTSSFTGWSFDRWANFLWGTTAGTSSSAASSDAPRQKTSRFDSRSIMFLIENTSATDIFTILGVECRYILRMMRRLQSQFLIQ